MGETEGTGEIDLAAIVEEQRRAAGAEIVVGSDADRAAVDRRTAGVGVGAGENQGTGALLSEHSGPADDAAKGRSAPNRCIDRAPGGIESHGGREDHGTCRPQDASVEFDRRLLGSIRVLIEIGLRRIDDRTQPSYANISGTIARKGVPVQRRRAIIKCNQV